MCPAGWRAGSSLSEQTKGLRTPRSVSGVNPEVIGSSPIPATNVKTQYIVICLYLKRNILCHED